MNVHAIDVVVDGIKYEIISTEDLTARVKGYADAEFADVVIPEYIEYYGKQFKVIEIMDEAFKEKGIMYIKLPSSLKSIGQKAFWWSSLKEIDITDGVTSLGIRALCGCRYIKRVVFGRGLNTIRDNCLYYAESVDYVFLPSNIITISTSGITSSIIKKFVIEDSSTKLTSDRNSSGSSKWIDGSSGSANLTSSSSLFTCCNIEDLYIGRNISSGSTSFVTLPRVENLTVGPYVTDIKGLFNLNYMQRIKLMTSTPPTFERGAATEECYMRVKVYVPKGSLNAYKNHAEWGKYWNIEEYDDACEAPEISYEDGMLKVTPVTSGSICYYTISDEDIVTDKEMTGGIQLSGTYNIEAYAMLNGSKSERSYATLCWFDNSFTTDGITQTLNEAKRPILVKSVNGQITVEGTENNEVIDLYTIDGKHVERTSSIGSHATFNTMQQAGQILIIRAGENNVKFIVR